MTKSYLMIGVGGRKCLGLANAKVDSVKIWLWVDRPQSIYYLTLDWLAGEKFTGPNLFEPKLT